MGKYGKITEALAAAGRKMEVLEAKMAEVRAKYEEALTLQAEREEAANDMRRELLGRHAWRYCRAGQLIPQLDRLIRSGDSDIDEQRALFGLAPLTDKEKAEAAQEEATLAATLVSAVEPHPAVEAKRRRTSANDEGEAPKKRGRKRKDDSSQNEPTDTVPLEAPQEPQSVPELPTDTKAPSASSLESPAEAEAEPMELEETDEERFGVFDADGEDEHLDDAPTPEVITGLEELPTETGMERTEDALPDMDPDVAPEFLPFAPAENASEDPLLF